MNPDEKAHGAWWKSHSEYLSQHIFGAVSVVSAVFALLFGAVASAPGDLAALTAEANGTLRGAGHPGADVSWPQCPRHRGGYDLPAPPSGIGFVIIGLTAGRPWTHNPCLGDQVSWAWLRSVPAQAYTMAGWPTAAQLADTGGGGPWRPTSTPNRIRNAGYDQARDAIAAMVGAGFRPPMVWIDVEPHPRRPWPTGTAARRAANRWLLEGVMHGLADAGFAYGLYSYPRAWREITGGWRLPLVPVWATAGRASQAAAVLACRRSSFSSGPVLIAQWYDDRRDSDVSCPPFRLVPPVAAPPPLENPNVGSLTALERGVVILIAHGQSMPTVTDQPRRPGNREHPGCTGPCQLGGR